MIQVIPRGNHNGLYGGSQFYGVNEGHSDPVMDGEIPLSPPTQMEKRASHPVSVAGIFRNLTVMCNMTHPTFTVTFYVNGNATGITATLNTAESQTYNLTNAVSVNAGDRISYYINGPWIPSPGINWGTTIEFEGAACSYGVRDGSTGGIELNNWWMGGALGNGWLVDYGNAANPIPTIYTNSYSICGANGAITRIDITSFINPAVGGTWEGYIRKNKVIQNGTGGTVDTKCTVTDVAVSGFSTFNLPVVVGDHLELAVRRTVAATGAWPWTSMCASIRFDPTSPNIFMMCGGNNDAINKPIDWKWTSTGQEPLTEQTGAAITGQSTIFVKGLYVEDAAGTPPNTTTYTLRSNYTDTALVASLTDLETTDLVTGNVEIPPNTPIDIRRVDSSVRGDLGMFYGLSAEAPRTSRIFTPAGRRDVDRKIPDPTIRTALLGD